RHRRVARRRWPGAACKGCNFTCWPAVWPARPATLAIRPMPAEAGRYVSGARTGANIKLVLRPGRPIPMLSDIPSARGFIESTFRLKIA
ncbi:hypothetical protein, partial [Burkholderia sp. LMG 13014]|uniref:hypothetical protein n=1 Tax=Burkholderia sp. LMG 13014 TaxID=2709306 RepID=UPI001966B1E3